MIQQRFLSTLFQEFEFCFFSVLFLLSIFMRLSSLGACVYEEVIEVENLIK